MLYLLKLLKNNSFEKIVSQIKKSEQFVFRKKNLPSEILASPDNSQG
jgi:hypothetical protein